MNIDFSKALPYRITVKLSSGKLAELYTMYAYNLEHAKERATNELKTEAEVYNFSVHKVELLNFNPKLR
jgi:hypothetical protein